MRSLALATLLAGALLAGCFGGSHNATPPTPTPAAAATFPVVSDGAGKALPLSAFGAALPDVRQRYVGNRTSGEPTIGVTATGLALYPSIAFDAFPSVVPDAGQLPKTIIYVSQDNGTTWTDRSPATAAARTSPVSLDPFVYADPATGRIFNIDLYVGCANLQYSDDGGLTWTSSPVSCGIPVDDHQSLASGPVRPPLVANPVYPRVLYYCVNQLAISSCTHSLDGGLTWIAAAGPAFGGAQGVGENAHADQCGGLTGHVYASEKTGTVFLPAGCGQAEVARSTDNGATWTDITVDATTGFDGHDGSVAADRNGTVYYFWLDKNTYPRLSVSTDDGLSWGPPLNVTAPGVTTAKFPAITAGAGGRIAFLYVGSTTPSGKHYSDTQPQACPNGQTCKPKHPDELHNATWNAYVGFSLDADQPSPVFATVQGNPTADPLARGDCDGRCYREPNDGMFDFLDIQANPRTGQVWASIVDQCVQACAQPNGSDKDVASGRGAVLVQLAGPLLGSRLP